MNKDDLGFLTTFASLSHAHFDISLYEETFIKAFVNHAKTALLPMPSSELIALSRSLFGALFLNEDQHLRMTLSQIQSRIEPPNTLETVLSNYFYVVLNHYVKSFYGQRLGWRRISRLNSAIEHFIDWSQTLQYTPLNEALYLTPEEHAIENLEQVRVKGAKITVFNTYQGVPIQYHAAVVHTSEQKVYLKVHPIQEAAARFAQSIYILGTGAVENDLFARIKPVKYKGHTLLELYDFHPLKESLYQRQSVRVQPDAPLSVVIRNGSQHLKMQLFDISLGGVALISSRQINLEENAAITLEIPERLFGKDIELNGQLIHVSRFESSDKFHIQLHLRPSQETLIGRYIKRREQEIIQNLKQWS